MSTTWASARRGLRSLQDQTVTVRGRASLNAALALVEQAQAAEATANGAPICGVAPSHPGLVVLWLPADRLATLRACVAAYRRDSSPMMEGERVLAELAQDIRDAERAASHA